MFNLLIADDERYIRESVALSCDWEKIGIQKVWQAANGLEACDILGKNQVDILVSDIVMPEMNGLELTHRVKESYPQVISFLLTGYSEFDYAIKAIENGVKGYILKPTDDQEIEEAICSAVDILIKRKKTQELLYHLGTEKRESKESPSVHTHNEIINKMIRYADENFANEDLSLNMIANHVLYLNKDYLGKLFKKETGLKFSDYLLKIKIENALKYLKQNRNIKVYELADLVGFGSNSSYFSYVFKKITGQSPTNYQFHVDDEDK